MAESTVTKSRVFKEDISLATGGTGAAEEGVRITSTGGEVTLTKLDASHIKFRTIEKTLNDLVDGGQDVEIKPSSITMDGTLTNEAETTEGFVKNNASGVYSGGNSIGTTDLPTNIDAANIANGTVSNAEFQYLNGVTSAIQTQLNSLATPASQAEQETGTEDSKYIAPSTQQFHNSAAKAWCKWTGNSTTILGSYNVASITDGATESTINFTTAFSDTHYAVSVAFETADVSDVTIATISPGGQAVGAVAFTFYQHTGAAEITSGHMIAFGDQ